MKWFKWFVSALFSLYVLSAYPSHYALTRRFIQVCVMILVAVYSVASTQATQSITQNKLMTPSILGVDRLYILLSVIASMIPMSWIIKVILMIGISTVFYTSMLRFFENKLMLLLLVGMCLTTLFGSLSSSLMLMMDPNEYNAVTMSLQASFNGLRINQVIPAACIGLPGLLLFLHSRKNHDIMVLGYEGAHNLGLDIKHYQRTSLISIILMVASINMLVGPISILGLLCVNLIKGKTSLQTWIYGSLCACMILLTSHVIFEHILKMNGAVGYVLSILGGISFIVVFLKEGHYARNQKFVEDI